MKTECNHQLEATSKTLHNENRFDDLEIFQSKYYDLNFFWAQENKNSKFERYHNLENLPWTEDKAFSVSISI